VILKTPKIEFSMKSNKTSEIEFLSNRQPEA